MGILDLPPPEIEKRIHPRALEHFRKFQADVRLEVPLEELNNDDLNTFLLDYEKPEFQLDMNQITDGLRTCMDIGDGDSHDNQTKLLLFRLHTIIPMFSIKRLLKKVYDRKVKSLREEQKKREEEERQRAVRAEEERKRQATKAEEERKRQAAKAEEERKKKRINEAYNTLGKPFFDDAKRYLPKKDFDEFNESLEEAVDFYIKKDDKYNWSDLPFRYRYQVDSIYHLKALEQKRQDAGLQAAAYNVVINDQLADLKKQLYSKKQNTGRFFPKETSGRWLALPLASINETASDNLFNHIQYELGKVIGQLAPRELSQFLRWGKNEVVQYYRFMPVASYCFTDTGCLDCRLKVEVVAEAELFIKPKTLCFNKIKDFTLPFNITKQISLGFLYRYFPPISVPEIQWQTIPLKVILALMEGNITAQGFPLLYLNDEFATYKVNKDKVTLPQIFIDWLKGMNFQKLHKLDIINKKTLQIIENTDELRPGSEKLARKTEGEEPATWEYFQAGLSSRRFRRDELDKLWADKPKGLTNDQAVNWALENCHRILYSHI